MTKIIAGFLKNRVIGTSGATKFRPTQGRVKAVIFDTLGDLEGAKVVDLFAGSGNLGFEALSRGAAAAIFVEIDPKAVHQIREDARQLGVSEHIAVVQQEVLKYVDDMPSAEIVFADPPYDYPHKKELVHKLLHRDITLILEADKYWCLPDEFKPELTVAKQVGDTKIYFFKL
jgi:16S rRNA (guanine966-N2)-methyltransferase